MRTSSNSKGLFVVVGYLAAAFLFLGCKHWNTEADYLQTVPSGFKVLPWPKQMETLFGDGDHIIVDYNRQPEWHTVIYFGGRYELDLTARVSIDYEKHEIKPAVGHPEFYLHEVKSVQHENGSVAAYFSGQWVFDEAQWKKLVAAKGDWAAIGIPVKTNSPVIGFDDYVKAERAPREKFVH
jgi:hypothetical protein